MLGALREGRRWVAVFSLVKEVVAYDPPRAPEVREYVPKEKDWEARAHGGVPMRSRHERSHAVVGHAVPATKGKERERERKEKEKEKGKERERKGKRKERKGKERERKRKRKEKEGERREEGKEMNGA